MHYVGRGRGLGNPGHRATGGWDGDTFLLRASIPQPQSRRRRCAGDWREQDGWRLARTRGSHRQYKHPNKPGTVTVAGKPSLDVPLGTLNSILKQAGLKRN